ncbi:3-hydroxyacyl-ACP dehydratase FabZ family protein [Plantactinospora sonchi]|uniref:ApeI dehydratase-like domain-containing protein n=1 Tax=Plantactinospora sonchi TaxID=1544735 RepID=A0ABU7RT27_9ACTN
MAVTVTARTSTTATGTVLIDPADPVFAGHYPGFPVLPGVYLIEFADQTLRGWLDADGSDGTVELAAVERCRFLRPVYPGDTLTVELTVDRTEDGLRCSAGARTATGPVADIRLRYRAAGADPDQPTGSDRRDADRSDEVAGLSAGPAQIRRIIPHRYPILLVDRVTEVVPGSRLTARKAITSAEPAYARMDETAGPGGYAYPVPLLIESWAQAAVLLAVWDTPNPDVLAGKVELAGAINNIRVAGPVQPGSVVEHRVELVRAVGDTSILAGETWCDGRLVLAVHHFVLALRSIDVLRPAAAATS